MPIAALDRFVRRFRREISDDPLTLVYIRELRAYAAGLGQADFAARIDAQLAEWQTLTPAQRDTQPLLSTLLSYEVELVEKLAPVELWRSYWFIKEWFGRIATKKALIAHESLEVTRLKEPPAETDTTRLATIRADQVSMLRYIYKAYAVSCQRENVVNDLKRWIMWRVILAAVIFSVLSLAIYGVAGMVLDSAPAVHLSKGFLAALLLIGFIGYVGAGMSTVRRLQGLTVFNALDRDPFLELSALRRGRSGIQLGLMSGSVFAILLYVFFASGIAATIGFKAGIFPASSMLKEEQVLAAQRGGEMAESAVDDVIARTQSSPDQIAVAPPSVRDAAPDAPPVTVAAVAPPPSAAPPPAAPAPARRPPPPAGETHRCYLYAGPSCGWVANVSGRLGFRYAADFFLMLLWAFIAGFAERLVPDVIDRTVRAATSAAKD